MFADKFICICMNIDLDRGDTLPTDLASDIQADHSLSISCHRSCVSTYTSKLMIRRHLKTVSRSSSEPSPSKHTRFKDPEIFSFQTHCIFCGNTCNETRPKKNPKRWRPVPDAAPQTLGQMVGLLKRKSSAMY